ncbi:tubulin epsilon and delta complex protein 1-like [Hylaeus volcanicus]|uniref:tubulin epsilon and delta complex protein 1-like n=1 Tax=Hylaeus volcanicus TaxID=313075 RepID=UPI0023B84248|nr:tubulin epsilon and delta complex protein 1-like [Hylaeus volcanicus]
MSDIKSILVLLCQHLNLSINVAMKPEYFRLAKFNNTAENVTETFWKTLYALSYHAVKEKQIEVNFEQCGTVWATKLYFAYLRYPAIEFYALGEDSKNTRELLVAFSWLLGTQDVLSSIIKINLSNSVFGSECSNLNNSEEMKIEYDVPETWTAQMNNILYLSGKVNYNIKEISELISERTKLISKVHAASIGTSGLPHLSVSELALIKRIATVNKDALSDEDKRYLKELSSIGTLLDLHMKWSKKEYIFFDWMVTVFEELDKSINSNINDINWNEVIKFVSLLHHIVREKLEFLSSMKESSCQNHRCGCVSRLQWSKKIEIELDNWLTEMSAELNKEIEDLSEKKKSLSFELKKMMHLIPSCIQL